MEKDSSIENIEEKIAFQENTIEKLNDVVIALQREHLFLKENMKQLQNQVESLKQEKTSDNYDNHEVPPHY